MQLFYFPIWFFNYEIFKRKLQKSTLIGKRTVQVVITFRRLKFLILSRGAMTITNGIREMFDFLIKSIKALTYCLSKIPMILFWGGGGEATIHGLREMG